MNAGNTLFSFGSTRAVHHLGTGHLCAALLALAGALFVAVRWLNSPPASDLGILVIPAWVAVTAGTMYLVCVAGAELYRGRSLRRRALDRHGILSRSVPHLAVLSAMAWAAWRGPVSHVFLVGLDPLLAAAGTIACLSVLLGVFDVWLLRLGGANAVFDVVAPTSARDRNWQIAERLLALALAAALVALELLPLSAPSVSSQSEHHAASQGRSIL